MIPSFTTTLATVPVLLAVPGLDKRLIPHPHNCRWGLDSVIRRNTLNRPMPSLARLKARIRYSPGAAFFQLDLPLAQNKILFFSVGIPSPS